MIYSPLSLVFTGNYILSGTSTLWIKYCKNITFQWEIGSQKSWESAHLFRCLIWGSYLALNHGAITAKPACFLKQMSAESSWWVTIAVCHTICHEVPFQISGNGMYGQGGKKNKMLDRSSEMHVSMLAGVAAEKNMQLRLTLMEWAPKGGGFPQLERTGSGKLYCITAVFADEKELHSETLKVLSP